MKEKKVYIRDYKEREYKKLNELMDSIKNNSNGDLIPSNPYKKNYLDYDGNFITIISVETSPNGYNKPHTGVKIGVERLGPDLTKISSIEKFLLDNKFKEDIQGK